MIKSISNLDDRPSIAAALTYNGPSSFRNLAKADMLRDILHPSLVFLSALWDRLLIAWPILVFLMIVIALLGLWVGRREGWRWQDSLYWAGITATTVGYGDLRPSRDGSRVLALLIAMTGLVFSGLVVALAVNAGQSMVEVLV